MPAPSRYPTPWSWPGAIALVRASCLGVGWLGSVLIVGVAVLHGIQPDAQATQVIGGIGQVLAGALSTYLGFTVALQRRAAAHPPEPPPEPPRWHNE